MTAVVTKLGSRVHRHGNAWRSRLGGPRQPLALCGVLGERELDDTAADALVNAGRARRCGRCARLTAQETP